MPSTTPPFDPHEAAARLSHPSRRGAMKLLAGAGLATLVGCATSETGSTASSSGSSSAAGSTATTAAGSSSTSTAAPGDDASCTTEVIPEETAGPYPGDGSNGPDVLTEDGVVRQDITSSFGSYSGSANGVPLTVALDLQDLSEGCAPLAGAAVYAWHCDDEGRYSLYSSGATDQNWLRGVQPSADDGRVTFTSVFPGCYAGRWPHIHIEVFESVEAATSGGSPIATSQMAMPRDVCEEVYAESGYEASVSNLSRVSLSSDNVFGEDDGVHELATMSGSVGSGLTATLVVGVDPTNPSTGVSGGPGGGPGGPGGPGRRG